MKRIEKLERKLRPSQIFDNKVFDELQSIRRSHAEAERKVQNGDLTAIDDLRAILEAIDRTSEYAERLRSKSAFDAVKEIFKTGVIITVTLFGVFITLGQQYLPWTLAPLGFTVLVAAGVFGLIKVYPSISIRHLLMLANVLILIVAILAPLIFDILTSLP
jgi:hypothetical protein